MTKAAFVGCYADFKVVKTRQVVQVVLEIPIEDGGAFVAAFGMPNPSAETPVALALLDPGYTAPEKPKALPSPERPLAQRIGMRCGEPDFWRFLNETTVADHGWLAVLDADDAASVVRHVCGVESRRDISTNQAALTKWERLDGEYFAWQRGMR